MRTVGVTAVGVDLGIDDARSHRVDTHAFGGHLARQANLTLIGRAKGKRFIALSGEERIVFDADLHHVAEEPRHFQRKASLEDDAA